MAFKPINLIAYEFDRSSICRHLPQFEELHYDGHPAEKVQRFRAFREGVEWLILAATIIRKDEDFLWVSAKDLLDRAMKEAAARMRGICTFDLLTFDLHREIKTFNYNELAQMLFNASLRLKPGDQTLIRYSSCYGLLQKRGEESWGKVVFKTAVEVFRDKPDFLYTLAKRMLVSAEFARGPVIALVNDLSATPLYNPDDDIQKTFLARLIAEQSKSSAEFPPEVYVQDRKGVREILSAPLSRSGVS